MLKLKPFHSSSEVGFQRKQDVYVHAVSICLSLFLVAVSCVPISFAEEMEIMQQASAACVSEAAVPKIIYSPGTKLSGQSTGQDMK